MVQLMAQPRNNTVVAKRNIFLKENVVAVVCSGLTSLSTIFQPYRERMLNAHFYSAALLKYYAPDT